MRRTPPIVLSTTQRSQLERWSHGGSTPYRLVIRARIVLLASYGLTNRKIARLLHTNPITVARWRSGFALFGIKGIETEAPRNGSPPPLSEEVVRRIIDKTRHETPRDRTHWSTRTLAREVGVSHTTVRRVWKSYGIRPNRSRVALLAEESQYRRQKMDLVGVYVNPPQRAVAISFGGGANLSPSPGGTAVKGGSQAGSRRSGAWMMDLVTTFGLFDGEKPLRTSRRNVNQEFLTFLRTVQERRSGAERVILLAEATGPALSPHLARWLSRHPQVSAELFSGPETWKQKVLDRIREASEGDRAETPPAGIPQFLTAVERWRREKEAGLRPFAWTED